MIRLSLLMACSIACLQCDKSVSNSISISRRQVKAGIFSSLIWILLHSMPQGLKVECQERKMACPSRERHYCQQSSAQKFLAALISINHIAHERLVAIAAKIMPQESSEQLCEGSTCNKQGPSCNCYLFSRDRNLAYTSYGVSF